MCPRPDEQCFEFMCGFCDKGKCAYYDKYKALYKEFKYAFEELNKLMVVYFEMWDTRKELTELETKKKDLEEIEPLKKLRAAIDSWEE